METVNWNSKTSKSQTEIYPCSTEAEHMKSTKKKLEQLQALLNRLRKEKHQITLQHEQMETLFFREQAGILAEL